MKNYGKKTWMIADGYMSKEFVKTVSHEAVCVLNTGDTDADITLTVYFEDKESMVFKAVCNAKRTNHIRLDKITDIDGKKIPFDTPYAVLIESDINIVVQYTRLDTSMGNMALMTAIAYPVQK